ncbi:uncharacterized protein SCHCODRAFT_01174998 [Schizophyllum commune H4-8]|nr:uncharacterized protein SCHCODRAFT_01174998 [Schizophyllum commune H4-8]KAI5887734.1 hypothetical protein SCHCODRAFT_01174998 [Schizophyllum commune H4-8]
MTSEDSGLDLYSVRYIPDLASKKFAKLIPHKRGLGYKRIYGTIEFDIGKAQQFRLVSERTLFWVTGTSSVLHFRIYVEHKRSAHELLAETACDLATISSNGDPFPGMNAPPPVEVEVCDPAHGHILLRTLRISEKWTTVVDKAQRAIELGLAVSEINPLAKATVSIVKLVTDQARRRVECYDAIGEVIDIIKDASEMALEHCDGDQKETELRNTLVPLIKDCVGYLCELSGSSWVKQSSSFAARKLQGMCKALQTNMDAVRQYTTSVAQRDVHRLIGDVETLTHTFQKWAGDIKNEIAEKLHSQMPCNLTVLANSMRGCLSGTREALLSRIETWAANSKGERGFCLYGASGKGKSAVAHSVAIRLGTAGFDTAFFSFDKSDRSRTSHQAFPTLAAQLSHHNPRYKTQLSNLSDGALGAINPADQWTNLFSEPFEEQVPPRPIVLIIDALDECPDDPPERRAAFMKQLDRCLAGSVPSNASVRFFITAQSQYGGSIVRSESLDELSDDSTKRDILLLVKDQLGPLRSAESVNGACLADGVATAANNSFGHAAVLCRELMGTPSTSAPDILSRVEQAPGQLYPLYLFLLRSHFDIKNAEDMLSYRYVVTWILLVAEPQRKRVFEDFAAVHRFKVDVDSVLKRLGSLLIGLDMDEPIRPVHASFRDFLLDAHASGSYAIAIGHDGHLDLADICLLILNKPNTGLRFNICQLPTSYALDDIDFSSLADEHISEGLQYACGAVASHLQLSVVSQSVNLTGLLPPQEPQPPHEGWMTLWSASVRFLARLYHGVLGLHNHDARAVRLPPHVHEGLEVFLKTNLLFWLEACSCIRLANLPSTALLQLSESLQDLRADELKPLVEDYIQFNNRFQDGIAASPPQVYISGLVFSPSTSVVRNLYGASFAHLVNVSGEDIGEHWRDAADNAATVASAIAADGSEVTGIQYQQQDGWLLHPHRNSPTRFLWIPSHLRHYSFVAVPDDTVVPEYTVNIDIRDAALGEEWTKIYNAPVALDFDESVAPGRDGWAGSPVADDTELIMPGGFPA